MVSDLLAIVGEPNRRRLLELLSLGEDSVAALAAHFSVSRSAISQHLGVLAGANLVAVRRAGRYRYYRLNPAGMEALRQALEQFWGTELDALVRAAPPRKESRSVAFDRSVVVPLGLDETFALLTEPSRLRRWLAVTARIDLRAGGSYRFTIVPGHSAAGVVQEIEPGKRIVYSFGWEGQRELPPGASTVTITLEPGPGGTVVRLVHDGLPDDQVAGHGEGWTHYLDRLVEAASCELPPPDAWAARPDPIDRLSAAEAGLARCQEVLAGCDPSQLEAATPCTQFNVAELGEHLLGSLFSLGAAAGASTQDSSGTLEERVAAAGARATEAWRHRGTAGVVNLVGGEISAEVAAGILCIELLVHAWDFARATGYLLEVDEELSAYVTELARGVIRPEMRDGNRFGLEVASSPAASGIERLVAFTGRDPAP